MLFGFVHGLHFVPIQPVAITVAAIIVCLVLYFHFYCGRQCRLSVVDVFVIGIFCCLFIRSVGSEADGIMRLGWFVLGGWYWVSRNLSENIKRRLWDILPFIIMVQWVYGIFCLLEEKAPGVSWSMVKGMFPNTALWGQFLSICIVILWGQLLYYKSNWRIVLYRSVCLLGEIFLLVASDSRGAWLGALSGCLLVSYWRFNFSGGWKWICCISGVLLAIVFCWWLYHYKLDSANGRLLIWRNCLAMMAEKPVWGWGIDGVRKYYMLFQGEYFRIHPDSFYNTLAGNTFYAFNEILRIGVEHGLVGIAGIVVGGWFMFKNSEKSALGYIIKAALFCFVVFAQFSYPLSDWLLSLFLVFLLASLPIKSYGMGYNFYFRLIVQVILLGVGIMLSIWSLRFCTAYGKWDKTFVSRNMKQNLEIMENAYPFLKQHPFFLQNYGRQLNQAGEFEKACGILKEAQRNYATYPVFVEWGKSLAATGRKEDALVCWGKAACMIPNRFTPLYLQMKLYQEIGEYSTAKEYAKEIMAKHRKMDSPKLYKILREAQGVLN